MSSVWQARTSGQGVSRPQIPAKVQYGKRQALDVTGHTSEGTSTEATHPTHITLNPIGRILPSSSYAVQGHLNGIAATFLVDTGSSDFTCSNRLVKAH